MNQPSPCIPYRAIKQLLLCRLQEALDLYISNISILNKERDYHISLYRAKGYGYPFLYISAIALQLSRAKNIPALEIATTLTSLIDTSISQEFTVQVVPPGLIHLEITQPYLATWLQSLAQPSEGRINNFSHLPSLCPSHLFAVQYAHARCCSLLYLAHREGLIKLKESPENLTLHLLEPNPIPWLDSDQKLRLCHTSEGALLTQVSGLLDDLYCPSPSHCQPDWEKAALNLSQAFQKFYSSSRIWGEVKTQMPLLAQARLGLVLTTQLVLRLLLQDLFRVPLPLEL